MNRYFNSLDKKVKFFKGIFLDLNRKGEASSYLGRDPCTERSECAQDDDEIQDSPPRISILLK